MASKHSDTLERIVTLVLVALCWWMIGYHKGCKNATEIVRSDTTCITIWDTLYVEKPVERTRYVVRHDTIKTTELVVISDTLTDSVKVVVPIEQIVYSDSTADARYTAYVSGYRAALDSLQIECASKQTIITNTEYIKPPRFGVGVQLGLGVSPQGFAVPYLGIGVQYRLW